MQVAVTEIAKRKVPWAGRPRVPDPKSRVSTIRWTAGQYAAVSAAASAAGLAIGPFLRTAALGEAGPRSVHRHSLDQRQLARLLGLLGNLTGNINQIARAFNRDQVEPDPDDITAIRREVFEMRAALMTALGREPL
jgi:uncharacterized protein (DUF1778 family)